MAWPSANSEVQDLFAKLLEKRFDRQPCCAGILYECMRFLIGHCKVSAAEKFLSFGCVRTEHRLVPAHINRIINVAWCFGHGVLLDPEACCDHFNSCEITHAAARSIVIGVKKRTSVGRPTALVRLGPNLTCTVVVATSASGARPEMSGASDHFR